MSRYKASRKPQVHDSRGVLDQPSFHMVQDSMVHLEETMFGSEVRDHNSGRLCADVKTPPFCWMAHIPALAYAGTLTGGILGITVSGLVYFRSIDHLPSCHNHDVQCRCMQDDGTGVSKSRQDLWRLYFGPEHVVDRLPVTCIKTDCCPRDTPFKVSLSSDKKKLLLHSAVINHVHGIAVYSFTEQVPFSTSPFLRLMYFEPVTAIARFSGDSKYLVMIGSKWPGHIWMIPLPESPIFTIGGRTLYDEIDAGSLTQMMAQYEFTDMLDQPSTKKEDYEVPTGPAKLIRPGSGYNDIRVLSRLTLDAFDETREASKWNTAPWAALDRDSYLLPQAVGDAIVIGPLHTQDTRDNEFHLTTIETTQTLGCKPASWKQEWECLYILRNDKPDGTLGLLFTRYNTKGEFCYIWRTLYMERDIGAHVKAGFNFILSVEVNPVKADEISIACYRSVKGEGATEKTHMCVIIATLNDPEDYSVPLVRDARKFVLFHSEGWVPYRRMFYAPLFGTGDMTLHLSVMDMDMHWSDYIRVFPNNCCQLLLPGDMLAATPLPVHESLMLQYAIYHKSNSRREYHPFVYARVLPRITHENHDEYKHYLKAPTLKTVLHNPKCSNFPTDPESSMIWQELQSLSGIRRKQASDPSKTSREHDLDVACDLCPDIPDQDHECGAYSIDFTHAMQAWNNSGNQPKLTTFGIIQIPQCTQCRVLLVRPVVCELCRVYAYCSKRCAEDHWQTSHFQLCEGLDRDKEFKELSASSANVVKRPKK